MNRARRSLPAAVLIALVAVACSGSPAVVNDGGSGASGSAGTSGDGGTGGTPDAGWDDGQAGDGGKGGTGLVGVGGTATGGRGGAGGGGASGRGGSGVGGMAGARGGAGGVSGAPGGTGGGGAGVGGGAAAGAGGAAGTSATPDRCANPRRVELLSGQVVISGDTSTAAGDEFPSLDCGGAGFAGPLRGPQLYYRFAARAGFKYEIRLENLNHDYDPDIFYVFPANSSCTVDAIQSACRSRGQQGTVALSVNNRSNVFSPCNAGDYVVAVDTDYVGARGGPFTLRIIESATAACTICSAGAGGTCDANVGTICNSTGTGYTVTDCTPAGASCLGGTCRPTIVDRVGTAAGALVSRTAASATALNFYSVTKARTLTQVDQAMNQPSAVTLTWVVLEAATQAGPYSIIASQTTTSKGFAGTESSGAMSVPLVAGRFYAIGAWWEHPVTYWIADEVRPPTFPQAAFFGQLISATTLAAPPGWPGNLTFPMPGTYAFPQILTTTL